MSNYPTNQMTASCPRCAMQVAFDAAYAGHQAACPKCQTVFVLPSQPNAMASPTFANPLPNTPTNSIFDESSSASGYSLAPLPPSNASPFSSSLPSNPNPYSPAMTSGGAAPSGDTGFWASVAGGMLMMIGAVVWFVLGLMADRIFFYPPILFIIGLVAVCKGLFSGNIAGRR